MQISEYTIREQQQGQDEQKGHSRNADGLTYFLTALLSSVVHDNWGVDEGAGSGHVLSE